MLFQVGVELKTYCREYPTTNKAKINLANKIDHIHIKTNPKNGITQF